MHEVLGDKQFLLDAIIWEYGASVVTEKNKENLKNTCIAVYRTHCIARCKL